jgi:prepilin signal peptidase PulO-like enzyme (type II secretory pathway)
MAFIVASIFLLGLAVGSFLNVVILRGSERKSLGGRSQCVSCKKTLSWYELIPIVSFVIQKGRCRSCGAVLSLQYPLVELGTGVAYAVAASQIGSFDPAGLIIFAGLLIVIATAIVIIVSDFRWQIIPNGAVLTLFLIGVLLAIFRLFQTQSGTASVPDLVWNVGAAVVITLFFAALWFFSRGRWMGFGDVKLIFATSLIVGFPASALLFSFWLGGIFGLFLLLTRKSGLKSVMPFGPFILMGAILGYFFADYVISFIVII